MFELNWVSHTSLLHWHKKSRIDSIWQLRLKRDNLHVNQVVWQSEKMEKMVMEGTSNCTRSTYLIDKVFRDRSGREIRAGRRSNWAITEINWIKGRAASIWHRIQIKHQTNLDPASLDALHWGKVSLTWRPPWLQDVSSANPKAKTNAAFVKWSPWRPCRSPILPLLTSLTQTLLSFFPLAMFGY